MVPPQVYVITKKCTCCYYPILLGRKWAQGGHFLAQGHRAKKEHKYEVCWWPEVRVQDAAWPVRGG